MSADIKTLKRHLVVILARRRLHALALHEQRQSEARIGPRLAAADPERDEVAFDGEVAADELARGVVLGGNRIAGRGSVRVGDAICVAAHVALVGRDFRFFHRPAAERRAFHLPALVSFLAPVLKNNLRAATCQRRGFFSRAEQRGQTGFAEDAIAQKAVLRAVVQADAILQLAGERRLDRRGGSIAQSKLKNRRGQAGVVGVQRNERRKRLQLHGHRHGGIGVFDNANRIFAAKRNFGKPGAIQHAGLVAKREREFLRQR